MKTGGRKAGTPNKATRSFGELMLAAAAAAAEAAGNEMGGDGHVSYLKFIALNHPKIVLPQYATRLTFLTCAIARNVYQYSFGALALDATIPAQRRVT